MTMPTYTPPTSPYARDPFYALGAADAYDEHQNGLNIHDLQRRANEMLDIPSTGRDSTDLYVCGYGNAVVGLMRTHIAQTWLARKQGRETSTLHHRHRTHH